MILSKIFFFFWGNTVLRHTHTHSYSEESRTRWTGGLLLTAHFAYCFCFCFCPFPPTALPDSGSSSSGKAGEVQGKRRKQRNGEKQRKWRRNRGQSSANCSPYIECSVSFLGLGLGLCLGMLMGSPLPRPLDSPPSYSCDCCGRMQNWSIWASSLAGSLALCLWWATKSPSPSPSPYTIPHHFDFLFWTSCANMYNLYPLPGYLKSRQGRGFGYRPNALIMLAVIMQLKGWLLVIARMLLLVLPAGWNLYANSGDFWSPKKLSTGLLSAFPWRSFGL